MSNGFEFKQSAVGDSLKFILDMLDREDTARDKEAASWAQNLDTLGMAIGMASNKDTLGEWDELINEWQSQGEHHSSSTGDPQYEMLAKLVGTQYSQKKDMIDSFEGALQYQAEKLNSPYVWNSNRFKDFQNSNGEMLTGDALRRAWAGDPSWEKLSNEERESKIAENINKDQYEATRGLGFIQKLGDNPIQFEPNVSYNELSNFINMWQLASLDGIIPEDKNIARVFLDFKNTFQKSRNSLRDMGVEFDSDGEILNYGQLGDIKQTYIANGQEYNVRELANQIWEFDRIYSNFEHAVTNQEMADGLYGPLTAAEVQAIFESEDLSAFKTIEKQKRKDLINRMDTADKNIISYKDKILKAQKYLEKQDWTSFTTLDPLASELMTSGQVDSTTKGQHIQEYISHLKTNIETEKKRKNKSSW